MRTTLDIADDVLHAAKERARRENKTAGEVISELSRQALRPPATRARKRNGVPLLAVRNRTLPVTMELVNQLRDEVAR